LRFAAAGTRGQKFYYLNFTHPIHFADNRQSSRGYLLTTTDEQASDAPPQALAGLLFAEVETNKEKTMRAFTFHTIAGLLAVGLAFGANFAQAQAGSLDSTFGTGGIVTTTLGDNLATLTAIEQSNGDLAVVTGFNNEGADNPNGEVVALTRYTSDGTLIGTRIASFFLNGISSPAAVAVQSNGGIVVAATAQTAIDAPQFFGVARFMPNGELDKTFGTGGMVTTEPLGPFPTVSALLVQPNGQILVAGFVDGTNRHTSGQTVLVRYNSNGSLDTTFGTGGIVEAVAGVGSPTALAELSGGSYLAVGGTSSAEFSSTGVLQSTVTPEKLVAATLSGAGCCAPVLFQPDGDFVFAQPVRTGCVNCHESDAEVSRFNETGVEDSSFSSTPFTFGGNNQIEPQAIARQSNGQIVVGGIANAHGTPVTGGLARLDSNGDLDETFANGGSLMSDQIVSGLLIQKDTKIVAIGNIDGNLVLERYVATPGVIDPPSGLAEVPVR
jgi:uncharacterized delta-60 repeat protein